MACHYAENVYTAVFTPREYQVELLDTSKEDNTIVCLGNNNAKVFVSIKLLQELASEVRGCRGSRSVFLLDAQNVNIMSTHIRNLTDLTVGQYFNIEDIKQFTHEDWKKEISSHQVLVMTSEICLICMKCGYFNLKQINLLVIDDCRLTLKRNSLRQILHNYSLLDVNERPRILGLTTTILSKNFDPARLEAEFECMEKLLYSTVNTSSDIVTVLRYCSKPSEKVIICANAVSCSLTERLEMCVENAKLFLKDHRYDPFEIYEEEFHDELQDVPDPKVEPINIFEEFLEILRTMGPWCADRAAFALLIKIENLKVKIPYERHYLLFCMVSTVMVNIRAICDQEFSKLSNESECIYAYSTPRVLRLLQVLRTFKPDTPKKRVEVSSDSVITDLQSATKGNESEIKPMTELSSEQTKLDLENKVTAPEKTEPTMEETESLSNTSKNHVIKSVRKLSILSTIETVSEKVTDCENTYAYKSEDIDTKESIDADPKVSENADPKVSENVDPKIPENTDQKISENTDPKVSDNSDPKESENADVKESTVENLKMSEGADLKVSENKDSKVSKNEDPKVSGNTNPKESENTDVKKSINEYLKVTENADPKVSQNADSKVSGNTDPKESENTDVEESIDEDRKVSENADPKVSQNADLKVSENKDPKVSGNTDPKESENTDVKESINKDLKVSENADPKLSQNADPKVSEYKDSKVSGNADSKEFENTDVKESINEDLKVSGNADAKESFTTDKIIFSDAETKESMDVDKKESANSDAKESAEIVFSDTKAPVASTVESDVINVNICDNCEKLMKSRVNGLQGSISSNVPVMSSLVRPWKTRLVRGHRKGPNARIRPTPDPDSLCAIIFVQKRFSAKILYHLINELCHAQEDFSFLSVQYTVEKIADPITDNREAEIEHRKQEEVLKKFRMHECNLLIATSVLEEGIDIPKCNLVVRFDQPLTYNSYVQCKGRAKMPEAHYVLLTEEEKLCSLVAQLAQYAEIEKMLLRKCKNREPTELEESEADLYTSYIQPYSPENSTTGATVSVATSVALVNKYCAKLPSDTFTRLTPLWWMEVTETDRTQMFSCSVRLPINSPLKQTITGLPMPNRVLARRVAALQVCRLLHQMGELDDNLLPVGKESFKAFEDDWNNFPLEESDEMLTRNNLEPRPGTTKRRQYYYKRVADALTDCRPLAAQPAYLYLITMVLTCPLPEEQNTRGRKIYPPEDSPQGFGILTLKKIPKICPFPIFTRSGEVRVGLELASSKIVMTIEQLIKIMEFLNYLFANVLRLQKYLMLFDPNASENSYFIVPTITDESGVTNVDWDFLNEIYENRNLIPHIIPEEDRTNFSFNPEIYQDAVVMPWYRNQDQPQYFYVAEICNHLNPKSSFPGTDYKTFEEYYFKKYDIQIQNLEQPLLDVDHTSARLNFLTPRYVNRKGVALPTSSEETKRAKRENLEQKQILVPELCTVHPFPASLWRKAVCLPCILYRINALLLADQIRKQVAEELALGQIILSDNFEWSPLNFGWSLSDVLKKSKENRAEKIVEISPEQPKEEETKSVEIKEEKSEETKEELILKETNPTENEEQSSETSEEKDKDEKDWMEIGTWSNEMAQTVRMSSLDVEGLDEDLPFNVSMCYRRDNTWNEAKQGTVRYGSPTSWMQSACYNYYDSDDSCDSYLSEIESSDNSNKSGGLRIEFQGDNCAEAFENDPSCTNQALMYLDSDQNESSECTDDEFEATVDKHTNNFLTAVEINKEHITSSGMIIPIDEDFKIEKKTQESKSTDKQYETLIKSSLKLPVVDINSTQLQSVEYKDNSPEYVSNLHEENSDIDKIDFKFSFDYQPDLKNHPGPSPSVILQALTMSNANDGINLERLETIGDSFLKYAITNYLYSTYDNIHEGKLSHLRSKQVSNLNLYRLGRFKVLGENMIATKFDPHDNWLPPCYYVPKELEQALIDARVPASHWNRADMPTVKDMSKDEICQMVREKGEMLGVFGSKTENGCESEFKEPDVFNLETLPCFIPYNLITQHSIPDKSVADCVEALIGAYLIECGPRGALLFMAWLGIRVLPKTEVFRETRERPTGSLPAVRVKNGYKQVLYGELTCPRSPLLHHCANPKSELAKLLDGYDEFENSIQYHFRDRSYLLQALTHASYSPNMVTDCYQRLEFLGDAVLDYLITRHLYEDPRLHSPGALTDLRSALVNNTIFASLAVRHGFHKYFRHLSPGLHDVVNRFVQIQEENGHSISEEYYLIAEDESEEIEDVEVPKALGDVFESVAGAIFLDSGMSLDAVWKVYYRMMRNEIEQFSTSVPKSPIRELLELEPETAKFGKPEKLADGRRVRVTVEVFGKGTFKGIGRNYRIAKCTAAKCALKQLKKRGLLVRKT